MALAKVQACLEVGDIEFINENNRNAVAGDNRDDCVSTWRLRNWLETRWAELIQTGPSSLDREGEGKVLRAVASAALKSPPFKAERARQRFGLTHLVIGRQDMTVAQQQTISSLRL
jgi:hypothetical protein